ncbi:hypothetical protein [Aeromicrobium sp. A1-2]|uniref:hypothetical protein n=1 Tax=Aeromicrobium sp. A1-2 TaxID=2107713 RepID=UPI0013C315A1|nr:hypothetical protein [Aeromicrobium sp. A1-2]
MKQSAASGRTKASATRRALRHGRRCAFVCDEAEAAARRGETAIGYRVSAESDDPESAYGVYVNPAKSALFAVTPADRVVVLAEG